MNDRDTRVFLRFEFRIRPGMFEQFEVWARAQGTTFWPHQPGILSYRTFRPIPGSPLQKRLGGKRSPAHGWSLIEGESLAAIETAMKTVSFRTIQREFLSYIEPGSVAHSVDFCSHETIR